MDDSALCITQSITTTLADTQSNTQREVVITCHPDVVGIRIEGLGVWDGKDGNVAWITIENGIPRLLWWADINNWVASSAELNGAAEALRHTPLKD